jgi:hypothetical protein
MVRLLALVAVLLAGCFEDRFRCETDADCDVGPAARCERDGSCTAHDATCQTERRYNEHSAELANQCFDDRIAIVNPCAGGQPPAIAEGCAADVCAALPACCEIGWSDACAQEAQLRCTALVCETRIAITATRGAVVEHWEVVRTPGSGTWTATQQTDRGGLIAWVAPAPGEIEPRRAGLGVEQTFLTIGDRRFRASIDADYQSITSVDFDRDGRDTIAVAYVEGNAQVVQLIEVGSGRIRENRQATVGLRLTWGDSDRDAFPDGIAGRNNTYTLLDNIDNELHIRSISATQSSGFGGNPTPGSPQLRNLEWLDVNGDQRLDLVAFGSQIRVHADEGALRDTPLIALDCDPPVPAGQCALPEDTSFAGAAVPSKVSPSVVVGMFTNKAVPTRRIYKIPVDPPAAAIMLADDCPTCDALIAIIARDFDGDHELDIVGFDAQLHIYTALSTQGLAFVRDTFPGRPTVFQTLNTSVTGVPTP